MTMKK